MRGFENVQAEYAYFAAPRLKARFLLKRSYLEAVVAGAFSNSCKLIS